jgi:hypothetical protein
MRGEMMEDGRYKLPSLPLKLAGPIVVDWLVTVLMFIVLKTSTNASIDCLSVSLNFFVKR